MTIQIQYTGELGSDLSFGGNYIVVCDHCGEVIDRNAPGNVEYPIGKAGERKEVFYLHKECSTPFRYARHRAGKERLLWRELKKIKIETRKIPAPTSLPAMASIPSVAAPLSLPGPPR